MDLQDELLTKGINLGDSGMGDQKTGYWKIAPGENAFNWEFCRDNKVITLGWEELGDLSGKARDEFHQMYELAMDKNPGWEEVEKRKYGTF